MFHCLLITPNYVLQSKVDVEDGKFVELHRDKEDPNLDATMTREVKGNQLTVVSMRKVLHNVFSNIMHLTSERLGHEQDCCSSICRHFYFCIFFIP